MKNLSNTDFKLSDFTEDSDFKKEIFKYLYYWRFFVISIIIVSFSAYTYLRYTPKVYRVAAKIQIIDKNKTALDLPLGSELFSKSNINLENEIEIIKSYPIISKVIENLDLTTSVVAIGDIMQTLTIDYPFDISPKLPTDSLKDMVFRLNKTAEGFEIIDYYNDSKNYSFKGNTTKNYKHGLPFDIYNFNKNMYVKFNNEGYEIRFSSIDQKVKLFKKSVKLSQVGKDSDIISLEFSSTNSKYSENIINELVDVFNNDGINDRRLIHKRTIDFVNERYSNLSIELDSIEIAKQLYKADNNLVDLSANSSISLEKSFESEENIFTVENQISITNSLIKTLENDKLELLPTNIVTESEKINVLIFDYNEMILDRKKLVLSAGFNNPSAKQMEITLSDLRSNIIYSLQNHLSQLNNLKSKLSNKFYKYNKEVSNLPEKEKILRAIERNQKIKESLYLYLLQKREEAQVNYAVTESSIKIVEYAVSNNTPVTPKSNVIYLAAILIGLAIPFLSIYLMFFLNRKIYSKHQIDELKLPIKVISEIPEIVNQSNTTIVSATERSPLAESFRVLYSKLKFFAVNDKKDGHVTMVTSTVKGEGKTFCATNLAYIKSTLGKKVLLIGADLHNPQIHTYLGVEKDINGLVNFLVDNTLDWKKFLIKPKDMDCDVLIGGQIPPNPAQLLNNGNFKKLIDQAKKIYDYVIIDTPPCLLVSDTLTMNSYADLLLFVVRCNHTDINILDFIRDSFEKGVINENSLIVLNGIGATNRYGYGYAYNYSYGYKYNYSYNYNYGYGYEYKSDN